MISVWLDGALYFCTGPEERKAKNLSGNPHCILTTGCNQEEGLDVVVEGEAVRVTDDAKLRRIADAYVAKYGEFWRFEVRDEGFAHGGAKEGSVALVFEVAPAHALGFRKGEEFSQTRWRLPSPRALGSRVTRAPARALLVRSLLIEAAGLIGCPDGAARVV